MLDARLQGPHPRAAPEIRSAKEAQQFIDWEGKYCVGRHRLLFPVYTVSEVPRPFPEAPSPFRQGALVAAQVSLVEHDTARVGVGDKPFILAPWSWFEWTDERSNADNSFEEMTNRLHAALTVAGTLKKQESAGRRVFVIDLQLLDPQVDFARAGRSEEVLQASAWSCGPFYFSINGPSLSLTLAFSAWAATQHLAVRPLIATGKVLEDSRIDSVGGDNPKCTAIARFLEKSRQEEWLLVFPESWTRLNLRDLPTSYRPAFPKKLNDAFQFVYLTDGFDDYRIAIGAQGANPTTRVLDGLQKNHRLLADAPAELPSDSRGFITDDRAPAEEVRGRLSQWLADPKPETAPRDLPPLIVPFDEEKPEIFADWLLQELRAMWPQCDDPARLGTLPVVVPVPIAMMVERGETTTRTLADRLAAAIRRRFQTPTPTPEQMAIALQRPGKLVLLVYPPASMAWWGELTNDGWDRLWEELRSLTNSGHIVVSICSDLHHRYRWFGDPEPTR
jgi:hypothetical protein